jgi:uncharacterized damage-inducible protein DinB
MNAIDTIRTALHVADQGFTQLAEDMRDAALTRPTPRGGNHPLWVLGHVTLVEASVSHILFGEPSPLAHWAPLFAPGTEPKDDAGAYPGFDELLRTYRDHRARNLKILDGLSEADLDRPTKAPPQGLERVLSTFGKTLIVVALHQMTHRGQLADARRAAGRKPLFTPGGSVDDAPGAARQESVR